MSSEQENIIDVVCSSPEDGTMVLPEDFSHDSAIKTYLVDNDHMRSFTSDVKMRYHAMEITWSTITANGVSLLVSGAPDGILECAKNPLRLDGFHLTLDCEFSTSKSDSPTVIRRLVFVDKQHAASKHFNVRELLYLAADAGIDAEYNTKAADRFYLLADKVYTIQSSTSRSVLAMSDFFGFKSPLDLHKNGIHVLFFSNGGPVLPVMQMRSRMAFRIG